MNRSGTQEINFENFILMSRKQKENFKLKME